MEAKTHLRQREQADSCAVRINLSSLENHTKG